MSVADSSQGDCDLQLLTGAAGNRQLPSGARWRCSHGLQHAPRQQPDLLDGSSDIVTARELLSGDTIGGHSLRPAVLSTLSGHCLGADR